MTTEKSEVNGRPAIKGAGIRPSLFAAALSALIALSCADPYRVLVTFTVDPALAMDAQGISSTYYWSFSTNSTVSAANPLPMLGRLYLRKAGGSLVLVAETRFSITTLSGQAQCAFTSTAGFPSGDYLVEYATVDDYGPRVYTGTEVSL